MNVEENILKSAFVLLFDHTFTGMSNINRINADSYIDTIRAQISLSRKEAQYLLIEACQYTHVQAGLVLAWEGVSAKCVEADFMFSSEDIIALGAVRKGVHMSYARACKHFAAYIEQQEEA